jgi:S-adenosylmethionine uptake transporter
VPARESPGQPLLGIACMLGAVFSWVALDASAKWLGERLDVGQIVAVRAAIAMGLTLAVARLRTGGFGVLATRRPALHLARSLFSTTAIFAWFIALEYLTLAEAISLAHASPLVVSALSILFLGERVRPLQWLLLLVGFAGVLVIARPDDGIIDLGAAIALGSTLAYAGLTLTARRFAGDEQNLALAFWVYPTSLVVGVLWAWGDFRWPTPLEWGLLTVTGVFSATGFFAINAAVRFAPIATIAPIEYTSLVWGAAVGYAVWGDVPGPALLTGAALIITAGVANVLLSHWSARPAPAAPGPRALAPAGGPAPHGAQPSAGKSGSTQASNRGR